MPLSERDLKLLWDMRRAAEQAVAFTHENSFASFSKDALCQRASMIEPALLAHPPGPGSDKPLDEP